MSLEILLIDPDQKWLDSISAELRQKAGYVVTVASTGVMAQKYISDNKYFAIFINFETQNHSGLQVLKYIFKNVPENKVFLICNDKSPFEDGVITEERIIKMGVLEILYRPIRIEKILTTLESYQNLGQVLSSLPERSGLSDEEQVTEQDNQFTNIEIDKFYSAKKVIFDVYIKLSNDHYVKILHAGDDFSKSRVDKYKQKNVTHLYFKKTDRRKYVMFINQIASKIVKAPKIEGKGKAKVLGMVAENFLEDAYTIGLRPQVISQGKEICNNVYKIISSDKKLHQLMRELHDFEPSLYTHSFLITFFAGAIIKQFEWQTQNTIETTALACMFHDIGKLQFPREMLVKRLEELNEQELSFYKEHPSLGSEMVMACPRLNETVRQIILQHHETNDGKGFPFGIKGREVQTLSNIVCLADDFVHFMEKTKLKPTDALLAMIKDKELVYRYKSEIIEGMMKIFADPTKIRKSYLLPMNSKVVASKKVS